MSLDPHDEAVLAALRAGSADAFERVMRQHYAELYAFLVRWIREPAAVDDILQETFYRLWTHRTALTVRTSLRVYLYAAVRGHALMYLRRERAAHRLADEAYDVDDEILAVPDALDTLAVDEMTAAIHAAIEQLPDGARAVFALSREQGLSYAEIAEVLGVSVNTVKTQLGRALRVVRKAAGPFLLMIMAARV